MKLPQTGFLKLMSVSVLNCNSVSHLVLKHSFFTSTVRPTAKIIDGKRIAKDILNELKTETQEWLKLGNRVPQLTAVLVGNNPASTTYVKNKMKAAKEVGIFTNTIHCLSTISQGELLGHIYELNSDISVDGILIQLPLPDHISERAVCNAVSPTKDVDGFHVLNIGRLCLNMNTLIPCTPLGIQELIRRTGIETIGKTALVCGRSKNVGMPIAMLLHADGIGETGAMDATTIMCHRYTPPEALAALSKTADIVVSATGVPNLMRADMVKEGACVIDVGINRIFDEDGKPLLVGDVDYEGVSKVAGYITPVPGGVGPMTVAMLMKNTIQAAKQIQTNRSFEQRDTSI